MKLDRWLMAAAAGMAALVVSGSFGTADARGRGAGARGFHGAGHARDVPRRAFHGHVHGARRFVRRGVGVGVAVGVPLAYGAYASGYDGGGCRSLRMRAEVTGSGYWWGRYQACRDGRDD
jgi:hypothetical protein